MPNSLPPPSDPQVPSRDWVALTLSIGLATSLNLLCAGILYQAITTGLGMSENGTQVLTAVFGGIVGVLGSYVGYRAGMTASGAQQQRDAAMVAAAGADGASTINVHGPDATIQVDGPPPLPAPPIPPVPPVPPAPSFEEPTWLPPEPVPPETETAQGFPSESEPVNPEPVPGPDPVLIGPPSAPDPEPEPGPEPEPEPDPTVSPPAPVLFPEPPSTLPRYQPPPSWPSA